MQKHNDKGCKFMGGAVMVLPPELQQKILSSPVVSASTKKKIAAKSAPKGCWSNVHIFEGRKALCGYKPAESMQLQFCAHGAHLEYVECGKCKEKYNQLKEKSK